LVARVFLSHASDDLPVAVEVQKWLRAEGHEVFLDHDLGRGLRVGEARKQRLYAELRTADAVVCLVTDAFLKSVWCNVEVGIADSLGCLLLPVQVAGDKLHPLMEQLHYADYRADPGRSRAQLDTRLRSLDQRGRDGWPDGGNPFPGNATLTTVASSSTSPEPTAVTTSTHRPAGSSSRTGAAIPWTCGVVTVMPLFLSRRCQLHRARGAGPAATATSATGDSAAESMEPSATSAGEDVQRGPDRGTDRIGLVRGPPVRNQVEWPRTAAGWRPPATTGRCGCGRRPPGDAKR
jgi:hypothetical protein